MIEYLSVNIFASLLLAALSLPPSTMSPTSSGNLFPFGYIKRNRETVKPLGYRVVAELNYEPFEIDDCLSGEELEANQNLLAHERERSRQYHALKNDQLLCGVLLPDYVNVSNYAPFLCTGLLSEEEASDFSRYLFNNLGEPALQNVWVEPIFGGEKQSEVFSKLNEDKIDNRSSSNVSSVLEPMLGAGSSYDGTGINLGIIGNESVGSTFVLQNNSITYGGGNNPGTHPTMMAAVACGAAPGVNMFSYAYYPNHTFIEAFDWMAEMNVNVIAYATFLNNYLYNGECAYIDYMIRSTGISFAVASGDASGSNYTMPSPALAANAFTVGSISSISLLPEASCYQMLSDYVGVLQKPTIMAPGSDYVVSDINNGNSFEGTSMSASAIAGLIARLMQEYPQHIARPAFYLSTIINGALYTANQTTFWDTVSGPGYASYPDTRSIISEGLFQNYTYTSLSGNGITVATKTVYLPSGKTLDAVDVHLVKGVYSTSYNPGTAASLISPSHRIDICDANDNVLASSSTSQSIAHAHYLNQGSSTIKLVVKSIVASGNTFSLFPTSYYGTLSCNGCEAHLYNYSYEYHNAYYDRAYCECGDYTLVSHLLRLSDHYTSGGHTYYRCVNCGHYIDESSGFFPFDPS